MVDEKVEIPVDEFAPAVAELADAAHMLDVMDADAMADPATCYDCDQRKNILCARHRDEGWKPRNRAERRNAQKHRPRHMKVGQRQLKRVEQARRRGTL